MNERNVIANGSTQPHGCARPLLRFAALACGVAFSLPTLALAQASRCIGDALDAGAATEGRWQPCVRQEERSANSVERNPLALPKVITPPGAAMKKVTPDPRQEERSWRDKLHRALRMHDRGSLVTTPECQAVVKQIADEQPMLRSLRVETRTQARDRIEALVAKFRELDCDAPPDRPRKGR